MENFSYILAKIEECIYMSKLSRILNPDNASSTVKYHCKALFQTSYVQFSDRDSSRVTLLLIKFIKNRPLKVVNEFSRLLINFKRFCNIPVLRVTKRPKMIEKRPNLDLLQVPLYRLSMLTFRKATKLYSCLGDSDLESFHKERKKSRNRIQKIHKTFA